ncbi:uncharacterized protein [Rutidosis leptorrhynchoides]|uniref:uncharacterized protein n=1 Tax=Rutidosis leptorrhynchoides TaxID=125765 RepID=UPI003A99C925
MHYSHLHIPAHLTSSKRHVFLDELEVRKEAEVKVMICQSWDTHTAYGKFLSTDFIASDKQGNVIQMSAKNNVAHHFISRLKEGYVYLLNHFDVVPNREEYRILKDNKGIVDLTSAFIRHLFSCIEFEDLQSTCGKYLIDVVGCVMNVGTPRCRKQEQQP